MLCVRGSTNDDFCMYGSLGADSRRTASCLRYVQSQQMQVGPGTIVCEVIWPFKLVCFSAWFRLQSGRSER